MEIKWLGHSCFKITSKNYSIITDPYENGSVKGLRPINESADMVVCSHEHFDHNARHLIKAKENSVPNPFTTEVIHTYHDDKKGALRGLNDITIISDGEYKIAHFGDIGCRLTEEQINKLKGLDAVLIPVGGHFTISSDEAYEIIKQIAPHYVFPMHYKSETFGFDVLETVDNFKSKFADVMVSNSDTFTISKEVNYPLLVILKYK